MGISSFISRISSPPQPQNEKNFKNYILILAIVNYRNWQDASPPLSDLVIQLQTQKQFVSFFCFILIIIIIFI